MIIPNFIGDITQRVDDLKWENHFLGMAEHVSTMSKDPSTKVGAVIADPVTHKLISTGFNGFPRKVRDLPERYADREFKMAVVVHAEENAILNAGRSVEGMHIFIYPTIMIPACCSHCAAVIAQARIKKIWMYNNDTPLPERWKKSAEYSKIIIEENGIELGVIERERSTLGGTLQTSYGS